MCIINNGLTISQPKWIPCYLEVSGLSWEQRLTGRSNYRFGNHTLYRLVWILHFSHLEEVYSTYHFISLCASERPISLCDRTHKVSGSEKPSLIVKAKLSYKKRSFVVTHVCVNHWIFYSSKTKHKEVWEVGARYRDI